MDTDTLSKRLADTGIACDAFVLGAGTSTPTGSVDIDKLKTRWHDSGCRVRDLKSQQSDSWHEIDESFIDEYKAEIARHDVVGQLFAAYPRLVHVISVSDYEALGRQSEVGGTAGVWAGKKVAAYLRRFGIDHLLLCGIDSSFGLAWITLYRSGPEPFVDVDAERARYLLPDLLYEWQRQVKLDQTHGIHKPTHLLPLTVSEMHIAILVSKGRTQQEIADELDIRLSTVNRRVGNIRKRLGISKAMIEAFQEKRLNV